jgi:hypothetical protein
MTRLLDKLVGRGKLSDERWIISWRYNGKSYTQAIQSYSLAMIRFWELRDRGFEPSIHLK